MHRRILFVAGLFALVVAVVTARAVGRWSTPPVATFDAGGEATTRVEGIYPSIDRAPVNLLRLYVVFSQPMSTGESRSHLRLVDSAGRDVAGAFLDLEEELWDPSGRRLTVLFDPGRIKRGLRANLEEGAPLVEGQRYRLTVDAAWRDARGRPLRSGVVKTFAVGPADRTRPDVDAWSIETPPANTRAPLILRFGEPLDRALLSSAIAIEDAAGAAVRGRIEVTDQEHGWTFTPERPWTAARFVLRVSTELEDVAGNNLLRLFDADLTRARAPHDAGKRSHTRGFIVSTEDDES